MSLTSLVAHRYAKTLYQLAKDKGVVSEVLDDLKLISKVYQQVPRLGFYLNHPLSGEKNQKNTIAESFEKNVQKLTLLFIRLLSSKKRLGILGEIPTAFNQIYERENQILRGVVRSVFPLSKNQIQSIQKKMLPRLNAKKLHIENVVEPKLIAGIQIQIGDQVIESNVRHKIEKLKQKLAA